MTGQIPRQFIDDLLTKTDVVEVINKRVPLRKAGNEYSACCPFHEEKTPSFTVSRIKQFYHCFGCGAHGTAIGFIMEYERLSFPDAIEVLANELGIDVPREDQAFQQPSNKALYDMLDKAASWYMQQLRNHASAKMAQDYLSGRGLSGEIARDYRLGFAPPGWDNLLKALGKNAQDMALLRQVGLLSEPEGKTYDRFRNRIMFPIADVRGRTIAFGGRVLDDATPKYLNSPETSVFHKGSELYGLYEAKQSNRALERLLVVEGYMDVIALAQFGITQAVATLGTAVTEKNLENLFRAAPEVIFCFDGDRAGQDAAWKALNTALPVLKDGRQARFLTLPAEEDPDTWVRKIGKEAFLQQAAKALPLSEFLFNKLESQTDMTTMDGRARLTHLARPMLDKVPASNFRDLLEAHLAKQAGLATKTQEKRPTAKKRPNQIDRPGIMPSTQRAIALLLQYPQLAEVANQVADWADLDSKGVAILTDLLDLLRQNPNLNTAALVEHWQDDDLKRHLGKLACTNLNLSNDAEHQFLGALKQLGEQAIKSQAEQLSKRVRPSDMTEDERQRLRALYGKRK